MGGGKRLVMEINSRILAAFGGLMLLILSIVIAGMIDIRSLMWELKGAYPLILERMDRQDARILWLEHQMREGKNGNP